MFYGGLYCDIQEVSAVHNTTYSHGSAMAEVSHSRDGVLIVGGAGNSHRVQ